MPLRTTWNIIARYTIPGLWKDRGWLKWYPIRYRRMREGERRPNSGALTMGHGIWHNGRCSQIWTWGDHHLMFGPTREEAEKSECREIGPSKYEGSIRARV